MKQVTVGEWVEALRSGEYEQTSGALKRTDGLCCLGVLCDLIDPEGWEQKREDGENGFLYSWKNFHTGLPPVEIQNQISPLLDGYLSVTRKNDNGVSFNEIADFILTVYSLDHVISYEDA